MKKLIAIIALLGAFTFAAPVTANTQLTANTQRCVTVTIVCPDGRVAGYAVCCTNDDCMVWTDLLCSPQ